MTHQAIEAAARARHAQWVWDRLTPGTKANELEQARISVLAFLDAVREPSPGMMEKGRILGHDFISVTMWRRMLAALRAEVAGEGNE